MPLTREEKQKLKDDPANFVKISLITKDGQLLEGNPDGTLKPGPDGNPPRIKN